MRNKRQGHLKGALGKGINTCMFREKACMDDSGEKPPLGMEVLSGSQNQMLRRVVSAT